MIINDDELEKRLKEIREHFNNITVEELDKNLEDCKIDEEFKKYFFNEKLY